VKIVETIVVDSFNDGAGDSEAGISVLKLPPTTVLSEKFEAVVVMFSVVLSEKFEAVVVKFSVVNPVPMAKVDSFKNGDDEVSNVALSGVVEIVELAVVSDSFVGVDVSEVVKFPTTVLSEVFAPIVETFSVVKIVEPIVVDSFNDGAGDPDAGISVLKLPTIVLSEKFAVVVMFSVVLSEKFAVVVKFSAENSVPVDMVDSFNGDDEVSNVAFGGEVEPVAALDVSDSFVGVEVSEVVVKFPTIVLSEAFAAFTVTFSVVVKIVPVDSFIGVPEVVKFSMAVKFSTAVLSETFGKLVPTIEVVDSFIAIVVVSNVPVEVGNSMLVLLLISVIGVDAFATETFSAKDEVVEITATVVDDSLEGTVDCCVIDVAVVAAADFPVHAGTF